MEKLREWFEDGPAVDNGAVVRSAVAAERLLDPAYDRRKQLGAGNAQGIRWVSGVLKQAGCGPALTERQLANAENLLAGDAGEQEVREQVDKLRGPSFMAMHDVLLPCEYGEGGRRTFDNQIDSLVICGSGIYCLEVKTRTFKGNVFDFQDLAPEIYQQISYHQQAVQAALERAGIVVAPNLVKSLVVVVARSGLQKFGIKNQDHLAACGGRVTGLDRLSYLLTNGFDKVWLSPGDVQGLAQVLRGARLPDKRCYPDNVRFTLTKAAVNQVRLLDQELHWGVPVEQNVTYNAALNDLSMAGLSGSQQNFFWLIVGKLFREGGRQVSLTARELRKMGAYRCKDSASFNRAVNDMAEVMSAMPIFERVWFDSEKLTVIVNRQFMSYFTNYSSDYISWNNLLFKKIKSKFGKTLFRKLVEFANTGCYRVSMEELRQIFGISKTYPNHMFLLNLNKSLLYLVPFFGNLSCELERGKSKKITRICFTFNRTNPRMLLSLEHEEQYLRNISTNSKLSVEKKKRAREIFIKNYMN